MRRTVVLVAAVALPLILFGCGAEDPENWSLGAGYDFDISGGYVIYTSPAEPAMMTMTIIQTGSALQGYDNLGREWHGVVSGGLAPSEVGVVSVGGEDDEAAMINAPRFQGQLTLETVDLGNGARAQVSAVVQSYVGTIMTMYGIYYEGPLFGVEGTYMSNYGPPGPFAMVSPTTMDRWIWGEDTTIPEEEE